jgi:undecaprenyl diphosphate synthase
MSMAKPAPTDIEESLILPNHVAIILDGNRRWAKQQNLSSLEGHSQGLIAAERTAELSADLGIHTLTYWAFSTENWSRTSNEVKYLMNLLTRAVGRLGKKAAAQNTRVIHLGRKDRLPEALVRKLAEVESDTKDFSSHILNLALDYGGADEINRATSRMLESVSTIEEARTLLEGGLEPWLDTADQPYPHPDLVIRTSGEERLSGFMPLQSAYAEYYFTDTFWPDFSADELGKALTDFSERKRRFGG